MNIKRLENQYLNPHFVTGFIDAEGCFHISLVNNLNLKLRLSVRAVFQIALHKKDLGLLEKLREFFGVGKVIVRSDGAVYYQVSSLEDLILIIKHLDNYPLITHKWADFELFKSVVYMMWNKEHLTEEGLAKIVNIKAAMNFGALSKELLSRFIDVKPVKRPIKKDIQVAHPFWVSGFVEGEGMFFVNIYKRKDSTLGEGVKIVFKITQDLRNSEVLAMFNNIFSCGKVYRQSPSAKVHDFLITGLSDILKYVIPFFLAYPLEGAKHKEFLDFVKVGELMKDKAHLKKDGLEQIRLIKSGINRGRELPHIIEPVLDEE